MDILIKYNKIIGGITLAALMMAVQGCESDFDPDINDKPVVVVNMLAQPGNKLSASITHSWSHTDNSFPDVKIADATVSYSINGHRTGVMIYNPVTGEYETEYTPEVGDDIEISVKSDIYGSVSGRTYVPEQVKIDKWSFNPVEVTDYNGIVSGDTLSYLRRLNIEYSITFSDPAGEENYYMISGRQYHDTGGGFSSDPIISENNTPMDAIFSKNSTFVVFSDRSIDGRTYTLRYTCSYTPFIPITDFAERLTDRIALCSISRDYYLYLLSIYKKYGDLNHNLEDLGLTEPKIIYSNVTDGAGIVAAQSSDTIVNDVHDIVCRFIGIDPDYPFFESPE